MSNPVHNASLSCTKRNHSDFAEDHSKAFTGAGPVRELYENFGSLFLILWLLATLNSAMKPLDLG